MRSSCLQNLVRHIKLSFQVSVLSRGGGWGWCGGGVGGVVGGSGEIKIKA